MGRVPRVDRLLDETSDILITTTVACKYKTSCNDSGRGSSQEAVKLWLCHLIFTAPMGTDVKTPEMISGMISICTLLHVAMTVRTPPFSTNQPWSLLFKRTIAVCDCVPAPYFLLSHTHYRCSGTISSD